MKIVKPESLIVSLAEQVATLLEIPEETVMIQQGPDGIEVSIGTLTSEGFQITGDVPPEKEATISSWAEDLLKE